MKNKQCVQCPQKTHFKNLKPRLMSSAEERQNQSATNAAILMTNQGCITILFHYLGFASQYNDSILNILNITYLVTEFVLKQHVAKCRLQRWKVILIFALVLLLFCAARSLCSENMVSFTEQMFWDGDECLAFVSSDKWRL